jgi:hypothetical protein
VCSDENISITKEMFMTLLKDNQEMMKMIKSLSEQQVTTTQHITNNNNNNNITNNFNLNIFLNEKCKDALNMSEFIDSLKITLDDLLFSKDNGITRGVTDIMMKRLKELDIYKRPIHCTDIKRDTMYIKDEDKWHKDNNHNKFKNTIIQVANKERSALQQWALDNPDWIDTEQKQIQYLTMVRSICEPIETYNAAKGSSSIAQAATAILTIHRPGLSSSFPEDDRFLGLNCVKNRNGPLFSLDFSWEGKTQTISELDKAQEQELKELRAIIKLRNSAEEL